MFTSRAEFRLRLRQDNADQRLTPLGIEYGLVGTERAALYRSKMSLLTELKEKFARQRVDPGDSLDVGLGLDLRRDSTVLDVLKRPKVTIEGVAEVLKLTTDNGLHAQALKQLEIETKYAGYIKRQDEEIHKIRRHEGMALPTQMDFLQIQGLSNELRQKLHHHKPTSLARAARIPGMTPAALSILLVHAKAASVS